MNSKNPLQKQLEHQRFLHGVDYVKRESHSLKKLTTSELARLNQILTGSDQDPWRFETVHVQIPTGHIQEFNLVSNPISRAREILSHAFEELGNRHLLQSTCDLYSHLVLEHLFQDANRRTSVLATIWLLDVAGVNVDPENLLKVPLGNLRNPAEKEKFVRAIAALIQTA